MSVLSGLDTLVHGVANKVLNGDITPGFNITANAGGGIPFISKGNGSTGQAPAKSATSGGGSTPVKDATGNDNSGAYAYTGGSGTGSGTSAADQAYYDSLSSDANSQLGRLDNQTAIANQNIQDAYNSSLNTLAGQKAITDRDYNNSKSQSLQDYVGSRGDVQEQVGQQANSLQRLLGAHGYQGSANIAANYGAARNGSVQNQNLNKSYARNEQALDTSYGDYNNKYQGSLADLAHQRDNQLSQAQSQALQTKGSLLSQLSQIAQARTGSAAAGQGYQDQVNALGGQIDALGRQYSSPVIQATAPVYQAPSLDSYTVQQAPAAQLSGAPGAGDNVNPFLSLLLNQDKKNLNNV